MSIKVTLFNVNASGNANVPITAKSFARGFKIEEDQSGAAAGLKVTWPDGTVVNYSTSQEPIVRGNVTEGGMTPLIGVPANYSAAPNVATTHCNIVSLAGATVVRLTEFS
jgi:hypothetical protein